MTNTYSSLLWSRITAVWLLLIMATAATWWFGLEHGLGALPRYETAMLIVIAFLKIRFVAMDFMLVASAPRLLRYIVDGWIFSVSTTLILMHSFL